jgi:hypothetical protein
MATTAIGQLREQVRGQIITADSPAGPGSFKRSAAFGLHPAELALSAVVRVPDPQDAARPVVEVGGDSFGQVQA